MKPSNTGIDWEAHRKDALAYAKTRQPYSPILAMMEHAAQIAIAEYRKELAAKVEASIKHEDVDDLDDSHNAALEWVLSLLNENDQ